MYKPCGSFDVHKHTIFGAFFTVRSSYASAVLEIEILSVCLSVRLSVTRVLCDETIEHTLERVIILVF